MIITGKRFSLICDQDGRVDQVLHDEGKVLSPQMTGRMLFNVAVTGDLDKMLNFFMEIKKRGSSMGWEINIETPTGPETFTFFGGHFGHQIGIAAATTKNGAQQLFDELTRINNEQTNLLRASARQYARESNSMDAETGVAYFDDLSRLNNELVNMQRELAKKNRELDELNRIKNQFLGIAAHDLRNPIGVIRGLSELLMDEDMTNSEAERTEIIQTIYRTSGFMLGLVNDLLDIANIESGTLELNLSEEDIREVVQQTIRMNEIFARKKEMQLIFQPGEIPCLVLIDRPKIEQVLTNLLTNAMKYSFPGSSIEVLINPGQKTVRVTVSDHGQGIRSEEIPLLFKPFQRASSRSTGGEKSTGLGLSIVKKIIEAHGGETGIKSVLGSGSEFYFTLPLKGS